ncbi:MAG TPA: DNA repair protein RadC [Chondromyces sp.]|nr:DNA repair protein RadC [Chondromyces sp.]
MKTGTFIQNAREMVTAYGTQAELTHLLAVLIGPKADTGVTDRLASRGVRELCDFRMEDYMEAGLSKIEAQRVYEGFQLARKWFGNRLPSHFVIRSPEDAAGVLEDMKLLVQEHFVCLCLNTKNMVIRRETVFVGSLNAAIVHPREVYKLALKTAGTASILVAHNHPSGEVSPSREDIEVTSRLTEVGRVVGIELIDHLIIGDGTYLSMKERGYL